METDQVLENIILELRRGVLVLAVLSQLEQEQYGYSGEGQFSHSENSMMPVFQNLSTG